MSKRQEAEAFENMIVAAGWQILERHIRDRAADHRDQLMHCDSWEKVLEHRSTAAALESVLSHIHETIREGVEEADELQQST